eukprot:840101-Prymnesium_polylepis.1
MARAATAAHLRQVGRPAAAAARRADGAQLRRAARRAQRAVGPDIKVLLGVGLARRAPLGRRAWTVARAPRALPRRRGLRL